MYTQFAKTQAQKFVVRHSIPSSASPTNPKPLAIRAPSTNPNPTPTPAVKKAQPYKSANTYLDRITIAGLHNYLYARGKYEKIIWNITFLLAIAVTMYYVIAIVQAFVNYTIVLDIQHQTDPNFRLPNPWVCHSAVNVTYLREEFERVKPVLETDKRILVLAERYRKIWKQADPVTVDQLIGVALIFMTYTPMFGDVAQGTDVGKEGLRPQFAFEFIKKATEARGSNWIAAKSLEGGMFECQAIVMNCSLNGIPFDCCRDGPIGYNRLLDRCFALDIRREVNERKIRQNQTKSIELKFDTMSFDPSFEFLSTHPDLAVLNNDTTISFDNRIPGLFDYIRGVEGRSQSVINVRGTQKKKLAQCLDTYKYRPQPHSITHPLIREYFEDLAGPDRYSVAACQTGNLFEVLFRQCGCVPNYDSMRPQDDNGTCTPLHARACVYGAFQNEPISPPAGTSRGKRSIAQPSKRSVEEEISHDLVRSSSIREEIGNSKSISLFKMNQVKQRTATECLQLCESWIYDYTVFSTSIDDLQGNTSSINRTSVTIVFDPEYRVETEVYKIDRDTFIASLGDALGLILGFSAITLIQLPIWAIAACMFKRKQMKVSAVMTQNVGKAQAKAQKPFGS